MKSKAQIKGHPLHPILISFPIAFFIGTTLFDILGLIYHDDNFHNTALYLSIGAIGTALLAAVPGIIDYLFVIPPNSSAKKRGAKHGLTNISVVILFAIALGLRRQEEASLTLIVVLQGVGVILLTVAGWMGGTLVYRNQIGVDIRYAEAGKWKEETKEQSKGPIEVGSVNELKVNQMKLLHIGNKRIVLCKTENGYAAFDDRCTHKGASLAGGAIICGTVQCPWHGSQFDVSQGTVKAGPGKEKIQTYVVSESGGKVFVTLGIEV
jgi:uncharacterized membrane protein/nitrite reductase/ring-hydroxylating ferredoxin subunit